MPNNKKKSLSNIKGLDKAHPYSRKALQIQRALHRDDSISKKKLDRDQHKRLAVERVLWFKFAIPDPPEVTTEADVHAVIDMYINRYEDEIAQIKSQLRKNRPKPGRLDLLESMRAKDLAEYNGGIEVPLMSDIKNVELLKAWEGRS
ncbi:hypothetical protein BASA81_007191 [Batrachochytrium salamandrivorans]|nr:hypothetical protein BASA81_007191 [Batrachochytrium salamandrivorans]